MEALRGVLEEASPKLLSLTGNAESDEVVRYFVHLCGLPDGQFLWSAVATIVRMTESPGSRYRRLLIREAAVER